MSSCKVTYQNVDPCLDANFAKNVVLIASLRFIKKYLKEISAIMFWQQIHLLFFYFS